jgi:hypothetical protein
LTHSEHLTRLRIHLRPFERKDLLEVWADTKLEAGDDWRAEIRQAIERASVAVLLVSADFLASDFISTNELPPLLAEAKDQGTRIIPVILKPCAFTDIPELARFQAVNDPSQPLIAKGEADREAIWVEVARIVNAAVNTPLAEIKEEPPIDLSDDFFFDDQLVLLGEELRNPSAIEHYYVYEYQHLDSRGFMFDAKDVLARAKNGSEVVEKVKARLLKEGWEGDGELELLWLPPFLGAGVQDTYGVCVWHVKQGNNGTSWLASPVPLPFERLLEQNSW